MRPVNPKWHQQTRAVQMQLDSSIDRQEQSSPLFLNSGYRFKNDEQARAIFAKEIKGNNYGRYHNPNATELAQTIASLEGAETGIAVSSGMAAIFAIFATFLQQGDHVVYGNCLFGSTIQLLDRFFAKWGVQSTSVREYRSMDAWQRAITTDTKIVFLEAPTNPLLSVCDIAQLAHLCKQKGCLLVVDNVYATPILQNPIALGADLVMHSTTKYIDGSGRAVGGVVVGATDMIAQIEFFVRHSGPHMSPFTAWLMKKSLDHLALRVEKQCQTAHIIAQFLEDNQAVRTVYYPHLTSHPDYDVASKQMRLGGAMISAVIGEDSKQTSRFIDALSLFAISANLGDSRSLVTHPSVTTHSSLSAQKRAEMGIEDTLVRFSIGLEYVDDIQDDLACALGHI